MSAVVLLDVGGRHHGYRRHSSGAAVVHSATIPVGGNILPTISRSA